MPERQVHDAVHVARRRRQAVQIGQVAAAYPSAVPVDHRRCRIRPGQADHLVPGPEQVRDDRRSEVPGGTGDKDSHEISIHKTRDLVPSPYAAMGLSAIA
ncbi:hypothetical protein GCM10012284_54830 [Mangrovihabitans endophyticus]|uniref:Uncharacterized protein n=1 Tax=Mangrovihabitans endophyticus TaxID=1751298 RepID=A0A8J3FRY3_9ACTN|nr:hypothetical protein GCM10012284_54830 [Mangrovihabitans endophyticus]